MKKSTLYRDSPLYKQFLLAVISTIYISFFCNSGIYKYWYEERAKRNFDLFRTELISNESEEEKEEQAWGTGFIICKSVARYFEAKNIKDPVILQEPGQYLEKMFGLTLPEPVVFYYHTKGKVQALLMNSPEAYKANYLLIIQKERFFIQPIKDKQDLNGILKHYDSIMASKQPAL